MNEKNFHVYSSKFRICVIDLTQIELATEEDKQHEIDLQAKVFLATTWEEIEMLAQNNEYLQETVSGVRQLTAEEKIRQRCQARETNAYWERIRNAQTKRLETDLANTHAELSDTQSELANTQTELANTQTELTNAQTELTNALAENATLNKELEELRTFKAAHSNNN